jgi:hypothetical protein
METMNKTTPSAAHRFAVCICNDGFPVALELHKIYQMLPDEMGDQYGFVRIVDETGDSALYPQEYFRALDVPIALEEELLRAS